MPPWPAPASTSGSAPIWWSTAGRTHPPSSRRRPGEPARPGSVARCCSWARTLRNGPRPWWPTSSSRPIPASPCRSWSTRRRCATSVSRCRLRRRPRTGVRASPPWPSCPSTSPDGPEHGVRHCHHTRSRPARRPRLLGRPARAGGRAAHHRPLRVARRPPAGERVSTVRGNATGFSETGAATGRILTSTAEGPRPPTWCLAARTSPSWSPSTRASTCRSSSARPGRAAPPPPGSSSAPSPAPASASGSPPPTSPPTRRSSTTCATQPREAST